MDAAASGAQGWGRAGRETCEPHAARRRTALIPPSLKLRRTGTKSVEALGVGGCVRQNRVVPAPVAGVKLSVAKSIQPVRPAIKPAATVTRRIRRRGERGISRKAIAQGMPECSDCTCMLVWVSLCMFAHETAGAASTRHSLLPLLFGGERSMHDPGNSRRGIAKRCLCGPRPGSGRVALDWDRMIPGHP